jgi:hypothetical protein
MLHHPERKPFALPPAAVRWTLCLLPVLICLLAPLPAPACTTCNRPLQEAIFGPGFPATLLKMLVPIGLILGLVRRLYRLK